MLLRVKPRLIGPSPRRLVGGWLDETHFSPTKCFFARLRFIPDILVFLDSSSVDDGNH